LLLLNNERFIKAGIKEKIKMSLDAQSWKENNEFIQLIQDSWIKKFNEEGRIMVSMPDIYFAAKTEDDDLIENLQKDFQEDWIVTSTRIQYNAKNLESKIIHYYGSNIVEPQESELIIPSFQGVSLETAISTGINAEQGLNFIQILFGTQDGAEEIIKNLEKLSGKKKDKIKIWTPPLKSDNYTTRAEQPERAACVGFNVDYFDVLCLIDLYDCGRSRGVSAAGARAVQEISKSDNSSLFSIDSGISRKASAVYFSGVQQVGDFEKYTGMFCFKDGRYVVSIIRREGKKLDDKKVAGFLAKQSTIDEKIKELNEFNPTYAHIAKYKEGAVDNDVELFGGLQK